MNKPKHNCTSNILDGDENAKFFILWNKEDNFLGPDREGWCLKTYSGGDILYVNIRWCPFCGSRLWYGIKELDE